MLRIVSFFLASATAVCFPLVLGRVLWPHGLSAGAEFIFWPATGVNVAFLLLLGWRYWPVILLDIFPVVFLLGGSWEQSIVGAIGNCIEALITWKMVTSFGKFTGSFDRMRVVLALLLSAVIAPICGSLTVPALLVYKGRFDTTEFWAAVGNWNLANGAAMLMLAPFLVALRREGWDFSRRGWEALCWIVVGVLCAVLTFSEIFQAQGMNFAFLLFPFVIFMAVRFGPVETSAALAFLMMSVYWALASYASVIAPAKAPTTLWFVQALCWVIAATALLMAALDSERRRAEKNARQEQERNLEISLREERARLDALRFQINPHFLFNALNSIRGTLPLTETVPRSMVTELADYMRSTLDHADEDMVTLGEEFRSVERYLSIERKRFGEDFQASLSLPHEIAERNVPVFLLQPLVENALRHGFESTKGRFYLQITAVITETHLQIEVANSGVWKDSENETRRKLGLENIRRRLQLLYGSGASLHRVADDGWVRMRIEISHGGTKA